MARYKLPATVVLLHVCRLSAEVNDPTDLLHRLDNVNDQPLSTKDGTGRAHRAAATSTATKTYRANNFVDPSDYKDVDVIGLTPTGGQDVPSAASTAEIGSINRMRGRNLKRTKAETRTAPANGKSAKGTARARRRGFRTAAENETYDEIINRAQSELADPVPIDIGSDHIDNNTSTTASDPTPDHDPELDHFRTEHVFDPHYNGGDVIEIEKEMRDGGVTFEYDESSTSTTTNNDFEVDFGSYSVSFSGSFSTDFGRSCKSSKSSGKGKGKGKGYGKGRCKSSKSSGKGGSGKGKGKGKGGGGKGGIVDEYEEMHAYETSHGRRTPKGAKEANTHQNVSGRNLRGEGEVDEDRMAALREEENPSLQGVAAVIAAHQQREDRQRQKKLQRRRNRTPEEKARDRALEASAQRR